MRVDLLDVATKTVIEAKCATTRDHLRMAIGQLIDYLRGVRPEYGQDARGAILVPDRPQADLLDLITTADMAATWRRGSGWTDSEGGRLTRRQVR